METQDVVILGGGLAGLTAGYYSKGTVYEADAAPGGVARSDVTDGFIFDRGIHVLQTNNRAVLELLDQLGVRLKTIDRRAYIYARGRFSSYPFQVNSTALPLGLRLRCVRDYLRRGRQPAPRTYEDWIRASVGNGFANTFLIPYSEKFWGIHPREMTFEWTGNRVPQPTTWQVLRGALVDRQTAVGTNATFRYPLAGGYGAIAEALAARVERLACGYRAAAVDLGRREVRFTNGHVARYRTLISTIPLPEFVRMASPVPPAVRAAAARLRTNSIFVVNLGIASDLRPVRHWVHFPEPDISFFRISFPTHFGVAVAPPGRSSISAEIAYAGTPPAAGAATERVIADLRRTGILPPSAKIVSTATFDIPFAYAIYDFARKPALDTILPWLRQNDVIPCGRYGLWTYFWSDEAMLSGRKAAQLVSGRAGGELAATA